MQVSWIDADNLKDLLARIAPDEPAAPAPRAWDFLPTGEPGSAASFIITADEPFLRPEPEEPPLPLADLPAAVEPESAVQDEAPAVTDISTGALPLSRIRDKLRAIRQRANEAGILTRGGDSAPLPSSPSGATPPMPRPAIPTASTEPATPAALLFEVPAGSRQERLSAFADWARQLLREDGGHLLVMNDDGDLLWGGEAKAGLVLSAMMAWSAAMRGSAAAACASLPVLHQTLATGHMLTLVPCEATSGLLVHAAVAAPAALSDEVAAKLREGLILALGTGAA